MNEIIQTYIHGRSSVKIADGFERAIDQAVLAPASPLPTVRALAEMLSVSPGTVSTAYRRLRNRGLIVTDGRRGTRVAPAARGGWQALRSQHAPAAGLRDLASGNPDPALLPDIAEYLSDLRPMPRLYGGPVSHPGLVDWTSRAFAVDGIVPGPICVVSGALAGIERVLREMLRPGDAVAVEDPGFSNIFDLVRGIGLQLIPVAVDEVGLLPEALEHALAQGAKALIVTPRAQNPTGAALTPARAAALRAVLAEAPEVLTIEDDFAGMVCHEPAQWLHAKGRRWAVVRSLGARPRKPRLHSFPHARLPRIVASCLSDLPRVLWLDLALHTRCEVIGPGFSRVHCKTAPLFRPLVGRFEAEFCGKRLNMIDMVGLKCSLQK